MKSDNSDNVEKWYWKDGLHDSKILSVTADCLQYDYKEINPKRNKLTFNLDCSQSMFEQHIKQIVFYNYKIDCDFSILNNTFWFFDKIEKNGNKYKLLLEVKQLKSIRKCQIEFDYIDVIR